MKTKKLASLAILTAISLGIFIAESQLPPIVPIPGVKLGLANIITLVAMSLLGKKEAGLVLACRILLGSMFAGAMSALLFSLFGGLLAYAVMCLLIRAFPEKLLWVVSALAAVAHNFGQLTAAVMVSGTPKLLVYAPALLASGIITGVFTGLAGLYLLRALGRAR